LQHLQKLLERNYLLVMSPIASRYRLMSGAVQSVHNKSQWLRSARKYHSHGCTLFWKHEHSVNTSWQMSIWGNTYTMKSGSSEIPNSLKNLLATKCNQFHTKQKINRTFCTHTHTYIYRVFHDFRA
jgi:hypothetical protein